MVSHTYRETVCQRLLPHWAQANRISAIWRGENIQWHCWQQTRSLQNKTEENYYKQTLVCKQRFSFVCNSVSGFCPINTTCLFQYIRFNFKIIIILCSCHQLNQLCLHFWSFDSTWKPESHPTVFSLSEPDKWTWQATLLDFLFSLQPQMRQGSLSWLCETHFYTVFWWNEWFKHLIR